MTKTTKQLARSVMALCMAFMMVLGTIPVPAFGREAEGTPQAQAGERTVLEGAYRIYHTEDATQRMAPGSNQASDGNTLWLWEQEDGAPYNCEMFRFEATGEDDGSVYWYCKQSNGLVMQAEASSVKMTAKSTSNANQKWILEQVEGQQDQYYIKNGSRYAATGGSRHTAVTMSDTPQAWTLAPVAPSMALKPASIKTGETVPAEIEGYDENGDAWSKETLSGIQLTSSDDTVVGVQGMNLTGKAPGTATVTATYGGLESSAAIKVLAFTRSEQWGGAYRIDSKLFPNYLIEAGSDWIGEGAELYLWNTGTKPERLWIFSEAEGGALYWHPMNNIELALQPAGDGSTGSNVQLAKWEPGSEAQMWEIVALEDGSYQLKNKASGKYVGTNENKNTQLIKMHEQDAASTRWELNDQLELDVTLELGAKFVQAGQSMEASVQIADKLGNASDAEVAYTCSKEGIVEIKGNTITGLTPGTVNITASATVDGKTYTSNTVHLIVTEEAPLFTGNEWYKDITTAEVNREPSHADAIPYQDAATAVASERSALDGIAEEQSAYYQLLSQTTWDFALVRTPADADAADAKGYLEETLPAEAAGDFQKEFVPQTWQTYRKEDGTFKYFDEAIYTNSIYPWGSVGNAIEYDDPQAPLYYNPVGYYRTEFETPENWDGREIFISLQAVKSAYYLYINGKQAGYSTDSHSAHDFNITPYLNPKGEKNTLALKVYRWSIGSYLENQDYIQQSGIMRDVYLYSKDKKAEIRDFFVQTKFKDRTDKNSDVTMSVDVDVRNLTDTAVTDPYTADVKLLEMNGGVVGQATVTYDGLKALNGKSGAANPDAKAADGEKKVNLGDRKTAVIEVKNPKKWFPDTPNLYMVTIELKDKTGKVIEAVADRVGFREIYKVNINEAEQEQMQITGQKMMFRGVNRHDMSLETGSAVKRQDIIDDLKLMKQYNVNAVRTSHYPNDRLLYDVADELGIYVYAEANVESHYGAYGDHKMPIPGADKRWVTPVVDRNMNMLELLKNHASVIGWSFANEATYTRIELNDDYCFWAASMAVLHRDPSRLRMYERESDNYFHPYQKAAGADPWGMETREKNVVDVHSTQYPEAKHVEAYAKDTNRKLPYFEQEYEHAMGQSFGSFNAFWDLNRTYGNLQGGFIWDWIDQSLLTKREGRDAFWGYGGDWIDSGGNADAFCGNGVLYADRTPSPKAVQMRYDHQQVNFYLEKEDASVTDGTVRVRVANEYENTDLSAFDIEWVLKKDDTKIGNGTLPLSTKAMEGQAFGTETAAIELPETEAKAGDVYLLELSVKNKVKPDWDTKLVPYDNIVAYAQFDLTPKAGEKALLNYNAMEPFAKADETAAALSVEGTTAEGKAYSLEVDKTTGILKNYTVDGKAVLEKGPVPSFWRAQNYNDTPVKYDSKLRNVNDTMELVSAPAITKDANGKHIRVELKVKLPVDADQTLIYDIYGNGEIVVESTFAPKSNFAPGNRSGNGYALPKVGLRMTVGKAYETVEYFGRGPVDTYIDRKTASKVGVYQSTVTEQFDRKQLTAQENGNHTDIRWIALTDADGNGIMVTADGTMESSALHVKAENINTSTYEYPYNGGRIRHSTEVPMDEQAYLCLDTMQRGVSNTAFFSHVPLEGFYPHTRPDADGNYPVYEKTVRISPVTASTDKMAAGKLGFAAEDGPIVLPDDVEGLKQEIQRLMAQLSQFAEDMADVKEKAGQVTELKTQLDGLSKETEKIAQLESRVEKIAELETELASLKAEAAKDEDLKKQEAKIAGLETELTALKAETAKINELKQQTDKIAGLETQLAALKKETDKIPSIQEQTNRIADIESRLQAISQKADKIDGYEPEIQKIAKMQQDISALKAETEKLGAYEADLKKIANLETTVEGLKTKSEQLDALDAEVKRLSGLQTEVSQLKAQVEKLVSLEAEVNRLKAEAEKVAALEAEAKKIAQMQAQIAALEKARAEAEANMNRILDELAKAQSANTLQKGDTVTAGGVKYRVTNPDKKLAEAYAPKSKSARTVTVAATVTVKGVRLSVTAIADEAFQGMKQLTSVTIGKNVKKIGKEAFAADKSLNRITVKSKKLKKIGSGAFKGIAKKAVVKTPKNKKAAYKKLFLGKGQNQAVTVK